MTDCESARATQRRAEEWRDGRSSWVAEKRSALAAATATVAEAQTAWDAAVRTSVDADTALETARANRNAAFQAMVEAEKAANDSGGQPGDNSRAIFEARQAEFNAAERAVESAKDYADDLTARAKERASDHDSALSAQGRCETELELAEGELSTAEQDLSAAAADVARLCG